MPVASYLNIGGEIVSESRAGTDCDYLPDLQGNVAALLDASQTVTDAFSYWPFGEEKSHVGASNTPFRFLGTIGYYADAASGRIYVRRRHYRPTIARWQTVDPHWPHEPAYTYVEDNPTTYIDPTGGYCEKTTVKDDCWAHKNGKPIYPRYPEGDWGSRFAKKVKDSVDKYCNGKGGYPAVAGVTPRLVACMIFAETDGDPSNYSIGELCGPMHIKKGRGYRGCCGPHVAEPKNCNDEAAMIDYSVYMFCQCDQYKGDPKKWGTVVRDNNKFCCCMQFWKPGKGW